MEDETFEQERLDHINNVATAKVVSLLNQYADGDLKDDDLLTETYALLVTAAALGNDIQSIVDDANLAAGKLVALLGDFTEETNV